MLKSEDFDTSNFGISEITLSNGGGQMNYWYQITLKKDGTTEYLGDVSPERRNENKSSGQSTNQIQRVKYWGKIPQVEFERLVKLINDNDFFSMKKDNGGVAGAPQTTTGVVKSGTRKEVYNQLGQGGEKLAEIERAISLATDQIRWEKVLE